MENSTYHEQAIEMAAALNEYSGENPWQDVVYQYDFDRALTDKHDHDSTLVVFSRQHGEQCAVKYVEMDKQWYAVEFSAVLEAEKGAGVGRIRAGRLV